MGNEDQNPDNQDQNQDQNKDKPIEKPKEDENLSYVKLQNLNTGETGQFTPEEVVQLATYGLMHLEKKDDKKEPENKVVKEEKVDDNPNERISKLEMTIKEMEEKERRTSEAQKINDALVSSRDKFELTKNPKWDRVVKIMTLAQLSHNPRLDPAMVYAKEVKELMEVLETRKSSSDKIKSSMELAGSSATGGLPKIDTTKEYTAKDLKGTVSRDALKALLESARED